MMPEVMSCLRRDLEHLKPDFLIITGDICSHQSRDAMFAARDFLDSLGVPYYPLAGNHDSVLEDSRKWYNEAFQDRLPDGDTVYSFTHKGLHFCVLDPWWKWSDETLCPFSEKAVAKDIDISPAGARWAIPPHEFGWLEEDIEEHRGIPTIVATHYPPIPIPKHLRRPGMRDAGRLDNGEMLIEVLLRYPQVKAVLAGHVHMHYIERRDGLAYVATGSLPEFPTEYREFQVYRDRIEILTHGLSDASFAARSLIPGKDWTAGTPEDRTGVIAL